MTRVTATALIPAALIAGVLTMSGCAQVQLAPRAQAPDPDLSECSGVEVVVDGRQLGETGHGGYAYPSAACVDGDLSPSNAQAAFTAADVTPTVGDLGRVCRVDGVPEESEGLAKPGGGLYFERCDATMPPDSARWVLWHQATDGSWSDTDQDPYRLAVAPGERVALVYSYDGAPTPPGT